MMTTPYFYINEASNFDKIIPFIVEPNTLVLCDIDETVITADAQVKNLLRRSPMLMMVQDVFYPTDKAGFLRMYHHLHSEQINGQLMFLTARREIDDFETRQHLHMLGMPVNKRDIIIHYTNNLISKGEYIRRELQEHVKNNRPVIFIDDRMDFIRTVLHNHPSTKCILYKHNNNRPYTFL